MAVMAKYRRRFLTVVVAIVVGTALAGCPQNAGSSSVCEQPSRGASPVPCADTGG